MTRDVGTSRSMNVTQHTLRPVPHVRAFAAARAWIWSVTCSFHWGNWEQSMWNTWNGSTWSQGTCIPIITHLSACVGGALVAGVVVARGLVAGPLAPPRSGL